MRIVAVVVAILVVLGAGIFVVVLPDPLTQADIPAHEVDLANGKRMFDAGGCANCHSAPGAEGDARLALAGGRALNTPFGTFYVPNISPSAEGIEKWSDLDFVNAMKLGISPAGEHYYPSFPFTSYHYLTVGDIQDLHAYIATLPPVASVVPAHDLPFMFNNRYLLGFWKMLYFDAGTFEPDPEASDVVNRGAYLVNGPGHCGECHTPRNALGALNRDRWLAGAPNPEGPGSVPNITPDESGIGSWSENDIAYALQSGFTPEFDSLGGAMTEVIKSVSLLPPEDLAAIAAYLKSIPPLPSDQAGEMADTGEASE